MTFNILNVEIKAMTDNDLFMALIFVKRSLNGPLTEEEFQLLENIRLTDYSDVSPSEFNHVLSKLLFLYTTEYFKRKQN